MFRKRREWDRILIQMLRGDRSQAEFARLLRVPPSTVWRWEHRRARPDVRHRRRLNRLARRERFLADWNPVGSMTLVGDLEEASRQIRRLFRRSLTRTAQAL